MRKVIFSIVLMVVAGSLFANNAILHGGSTTTWITQWEEHDVLALIEFSDQSSGGVRNSGIMIIGTTDVPEGQPFKPVMQFIFDYYVSDNTFTLDWTYADINEGSTGEVDEQVVFQALNYQRIRFLVKSGERHLIIGEQVFRRIE